VIDESVRSGQVIEFLHGDVTVVGSVGSGAEIVAGGSIHIYGSLRGRALAGTGGDPTARIFCRKFQAELLAINGSYRLADNFPAELRDRAVQARMEGVRMSLSPID
jgi:septum site-determining protein MinC